MMRCLIRNGVMALGHRGVGWGRGGGISTILVAAVLSDYGRVGRCIYILVERDIQVIMVCYCLMK